MSDQNYLTVGQLAREAGTTVRTLQYYDQQGLLSPSAKGPGNQRLYEPGDIEQLYRILTLKYLGLSLAEIKDRVESINDAAAFRDVLSHTMESLEEDFQNLVKRLSVLKNLYKQTPEQGSIDWTLFARTIAADDESGELFWHHIDEVSPASGEEARAQERSQNHGMAVAKWHELIADAIAFMSDHITPDDPRTAELAQRYRELENAQEGSLSQMFVLAENVSPHRGTSGSFDVLRDSVLKYLGEVKRAHEAECE